MAQGVIARCLKDFEAVPKTYRTTSKAQAAELQLRIAQAILGKKIELAEVSIDCTTKQVNQNNAEILGNLEAILLHIKGL
nr:hypothetical protein 4 [bacterium]